MRHGAGPRRSGGCHDAARDSVGSGRRLRTRDRTTGWDGTTVRNDTAAADPGPYTERRRRPEPAIGGKTTSSTQSGIRTHDGPRPDRGRPASRPGRPSSSMPGRFRSRSDRRTVSQPNALSQASGRTDGDTGPDPPMFPDHSINTDLGVGADLCTFRKVRALEHRGMSTNHGIWAELRVTVDQRAGPNRRTRANDRRGADGSISRNDGILRHMGTIGDRSAVLPRLRSQGERQAPPRPSHGHGHRRHDVPIPSPAAAPPAPRAPAGREAEAPQQCRPARRRRVPRVSRYEPRLRRSFQNPAAPQPRSVRHSREWPWPPPRHGRRRWLDREPRRRRRSR